MMIMSLHMLSTRLFLVVFTSFDRSCMKFGISSVTYSTHFLFDVYIWSNLNALITTEFFCYGVTSSQGEEAIFRSALTFALRFSPYCNCASSTRRTMLSVR